MRILLWAPTYLPAVGGVEWFVHDLAVELANQGQNVSILDGRHDQPKVQFENWTLDSVPTFRLPCPSPTNNPKSWIEEQTRKLRKLLEGIRPDVVNMQFIGDQTHYAVELRSALNYRLVVTAQGSDLNFLRQRSRLHQEIVRRCLSEADAFSACSPQLLHLGALLVPDVTTRSFLIPNAVKSMFFCRMPSLVSSHCYIVACGRLVSVKGFDILLQALSYMKEPIPKLLLVGDGPEKATLGTLASSLQIDDKVKFCGLCSPRQIASLMQGSSFCVIPSREEGFPLTALEAMASSRAIVATKVGGLTLAVHPNQNGMLVSPNDPLELSKAMEFLRENPDIAEHMGKKGRELAQRYRIETITSEYLDLYERLL